MEADFNLFDAKVCSILDYPTIATEFRSYLCFILLALCQAKLCFVNDEFGFIFKTNCDWHL